jgi:hypothetical protein
LSIKKFVSFSRHLSAIYMNPTIFNPVIVLRISMKFDDSTTYIMQMLLTPKDLSFVGYTYKNFDAVKGLHQSFGMKFYF